MCNHVCQCSRIIVGNDDQASTSQIPLSHQSVGAGEWVWSTRDAFATPATSSSGLGFAYTSSSVSKLAQQPAYQHEASFKTKGTSTASWLTQNNSLDSLWSTIQPGKDCNMLASAVAADLSSAVLDCGNRFQSEILPERQDALSTPGLMHSPPSATTFEANITVVTGLPFVAHATSSVSSSVPATPTSMGMLEFEPVLEHVHAKQADFVETESSVLGLEHAFAFTNLHQTQNLAVEPPQNMELVQATLETQSAPMCTCSASMTQSLTSVSSLPVPTHVATPAPGWLNSDVVPVEMPIEAVSSGMAFSQATFDDWSNFDGQSPWSPVTPVNAPASTSRYEPYRNASMTSMGSSSSHGFVVCSPTLSAHGIAGDDTPVSRCRSRTISSFSGIAASLVDRVRVMDVCSSGLQTPSLPGSPRLNATKQFNSMPNRRLRPSMPNLVTGLSLGCDNGSIEIGKAQERRTSSLACRTRNTVTRKRATLAGIFDAHDPADAIQAENNVPASISPALSGSCTHDLPASIDGEVEETAEVETEGVGEGEGESKAKLALHHHRTKHQRTVLNEVVTWLQAAYRHCRRQTEVVYTQLDGLGWETNSSNTMRVMYVGETKEMRKNRQKAESKMRMRRKEIAQFTALVSYAKVASAYLSGIGCHDAVGKGLVEAFQEHGEAMVDLVAMEKRLFHAVRVQLDLSELVVRKLAAQLESL